MRSLAAITRDVPSSINAGELTHLPRSRIDLARARDQHRDYQRALASAGCAVTSLPELPAFPDSVFVEDAAVVLDEVAVLTRPGAPTRQGEVDHLVEALSVHRPLLRIEAPATLDGGDVLRLGRTLWVGRSARTNAAAVAQLARCLAHFAYEVRAADLRDALHLKTAVTRVGERLLLVNPAWVDASQFGDWDVLPVDPTEPFAANAVWVNGRVIHSSAYPRTQARLRARGIDVLPVDASELAKAEGGVTCCSLLVGDTGEGRREMPDGA